MSDKNLMQWWIFHALQLCTKEYVIRKPTLEKNVSGPDSFDSGDQVIYPDPVWTRDLTLSPIILKNLRILNSCKVKGTYRTDLN